MGFLLLGSYTDGDLKQFKYNIYNVVMDICDFNDCLGNEDWGAILMISSIMFF